jgi:YVTN family beta-propeller protein
MQHRIQPSAAPALVALILSSLCFGGASTPASAFPWGPGALAISPDGKRVYMTDPWGPGIAVVDAGTNQLVSILPLGGASLAVSPDGAQLYGTDGDKLNIVNLAAGKVVAKVTVGNLPGRIVVRPDGQRVYVVAGSSGTVTVIDPAADQVVATIKVGSNPRGMAIQPDGQRLFVANSGRVRSSSGSLTGTVSVIDTAKNQVIVTVNVHGTPDAVAVSPDGRRVYVTHGEASNAMDVINTAPVGLIGAELYIPGGNSSAVAVSPDSQRLYVIDAEYPIVAAIDATASSAGVLGVAPPEKGPISLVVSPDGRRLYVADIRSVTVSVIDAATLQGVATIDLH